MSTETRIPRRKFLKYSVGVSLGFSGLLAYQTWRRQGEYRFGGRLVGANAKVGHLLRSPNKPPPTKFKTVETVIVGGGISGLSAAWWLKRKNYHNFVLLEMDQNIGGNSQYGENQTSKYPWGAHYVPLPNESATYVRTLFEELGVIAGYKENLPIYNDYFLCADPNERLYFQGRWHDGLVPQYGIDDSHRLEYRDFFSHIEELKVKLGRDGLKAFSIPIEMSSKDPELLKLDKISMAEYLKIKGWTSKYLNWYVNYCCRDDYGVALDRVSAWAGLHYFASRTGRGSNADSQTVLTWPEGNGWLVKQLASKVKSHAFTNALAINIENKASQCLVDVLDTITSTTTRYQAKNVIYCGPRYTAKRVIKNYSLDIGQGLEFQPWLVANITLDKKPEGEGVSLAWDNVSFYSKSLGYIVATHQDLNVQRKSTVITYYLPLDTGDAKQARKTVYNNSYSDWVNLVLPDLEKMHSGITNQISNFDIWVWGHGMVSPGIDFLWNERRQEMLKPFGNIVFAHSDMSGVSIFEEAQYRGVEAAKKVLNRNSTRQEST